MKVCHCTTVHPRDDIRILFKQCNSLVKENHEVFLIVADGKGNETRDNVIIIDIGAFRSNRFKRVTAGKRKLLKEAINIKADVYHFHDPELLSAGKAIKKNGGKVVYDSHEDVPKQILYKKWLGPFWLRKILANQFDKYEKRVVKKFDGLVSVVDEITEKFSCRHKVTLKNYPLIGIYKQYVIPYSQKKKQLVYVGSLSEERGIKDCINAMKLLPSDYKMVLIGKFSSKDFETECRNLKEWDRIEYKGFLNIKDVAPILGESMVGLCILHPEENYKVSLPTKGFEYIAAGTPVVLSDFEYWKPFFEGSGTFVEPCLPSLIAEAVKDIINSEDKYMKIQESGKINVDKYSWESEEKKLIDLYTKIMK